MRKRFTFLKNDSHILLKLNKLHIRIQLLYVILCYLIPSLIQSNSIEIKAKKLIKLKTYSLKTRISTYVASGSVIASKLPFYTPNKNKATFIDLKLHSLLEYTYQDFVYSFRQTSFYNPIYSPKWTQALNKKCTTSNTHNSSTLLGIDYGRHFTGIAIAYKHLPQNRLNYKKDPKFISSLERNLLCPFQSKHLKPRGNFFLEDEENKKTAKFFKEKILYLDNSLHKYHLGHNNPDNATNYNTNGDKFDKLNTYHNQDVKFHNFEHFINSKRNSIKKLKKSKFSKTSLPKVVTRKFIYEDLSNTLNNPLPVYKIHPLALIELHSTQCNKRLAKEILKLAIQYNAHTIVIGGHETTEIPKILSNFTRNNTSNTFYTEFLEAIYNVSYDLDLCPIPSLWMTKEAYSTEKAKLWFRHQNHLRRDFLKTSHMEYYSRLDPLAACFILQRFITCSIQSFTEIN